MENKSNAEDTAGLWIGPYVGSAEIDRSGGGNITVISRGSTEGHFAFAAGAKLHIRLQTAPSVSEMLT